MILLEKCYKVSKFECYGIKKVGDLNQNGFSSLKNNSFDIKVQFFF